VVTTGRQDQSTADDCLELNMATTRTANAHWEGSLLEGSGRVSLDSSGLGTFEVTWASRAEDPNGRTSPEELIAAAHSSCFNMALSNGLAKAGNPPAALDTRADVTFQPGEGITGIVLTVRARVPGMSAEDFQAAAEDAKANCPVSQALTGTTITLDAALV
jgi:osmotically inducible protein OsmC